VSSGGTREAVNFAYTLLKAAPRERLALVELANDGSRREWTFGEVADRSRALSAHLARIGVGRGDVVLTLIGNRPEWVFSMLACFRIGAVVLPCNEQLRSKDLALRLSVTRPSAVIADERNREQLLDASPPCPILLVPDDALGTSAGLRLPDVAAPRPDEPALITFTSGSSGAPKAVVHAQRYLFGQRLQGEHWLGARAGDLVWCTAATGWSKSARNAFIAPWLRGAAALLHDARFDPTERLEIIDREGVDILCMAPTEYRVMAKRGALRRLRSARRLVAAGEALNPEILARWREATGLEIADGYGQTETGQLTGTRIGEPARPGSMGRALPGVGLWVDGGELVANPRTIPTFFTGYLGDAAPDPDTPWRTGDQVFEDDEGHLFYVGRIDDVIISSGYRIGPFEVESALVEHPAVADVAVVAAPDDERGSVVRAVVVLRDGFAPSQDLAAALQRHVRQQTAPYKYPRIVDFAEELPRTDTGKVRRAALRA
jgi:acyl-coenzyme A synthetase/AMP-(fatty) acid ligase